MHHFALISSLTLAALSCSCIGDLVMVNASEHSAVVTLALARGDSTDPICRCPDGFTRDYIGIAAAATDDELRRAVWTPLEGYVVQKDSTGSRVMTVAVTLAPRTALRIGRLAANCAGGFLGAEAPSSVEIGGEGAPKRITPAEIPQAFQARTRDLYVYEIRS